VNEERRFAFPMKITIDIDCTPQEARAFMGLPDLTGVNKVVTTALEARTKEQIDTLSDPVKFWERAMVSGGQSMEAMQAAFQQAMKAADKA
jgi:hypothetical protein